VIVAKVSVKGRTAPARTNTPGRGNLAIKQPPTATTKKIAPTIKQLRGDAVDKAVRKNSSETSLARESRE
jgi:hypothetical protein